MGKKRIVAAIAAVWAAYVIWPYVTLYRLGEAIRGGDDTTLEALVDWDGVREGIKEDISDTVLEPRADDVASSDSKLPPFGFSFVRGITGSAVDSSVTPQGLVSAARPPGAEGQPRPPVACPNPTISWAFFDSPTSFTVLLRSPVLPPEQPIRIELALRAGAWKVIRAWLPPAMLIAAHSRT